MLQYLWRRHLKAKNSSNNLSIPKEVDVNFTFALKAESRKLV